VVHKKRISFGKDLIKANFLVNYGFSWDISKCVNSKASNSNFIEKIASADISRIDLIIRWGGRRRMRGFLPLQSIYADFYVIYDMCPDFKKEHLYEALEWYRQQEVTLGG